MFGGCVVIVDDARDSLVPAIYHLLSENNLNCIVLRAQEISSMSLEFSQTGGFLNGKLISALIFNARPDNLYSEGFEEKDRNFCDQETKAIWLAVQSSGIPTLNLLDAEIWYTSSEWSVWLQRFMEEGLDTASMYIGDADVLGLETWLPWGGGKAKPPGRFARKSFAPVQLFEKPFIRHLIVYGNVFPGSDQKGIEQGARFLAKQGINFAEITATSTGKLVSCTAFPIVEKRLIGQVAPLIAGGFLEDLYRGR